MDKRVASWGGRLHVRRGDGESLLPWHLLSALVVLVLPGIARFGQPPWELPPGDQVQSWVWAATYLLVSLACTRLASRPAGAPTAVVLLTVATGWGAAYALLLAIPDASHSRVVAITSAAIGSVLGLLPLSAGRRVRRAFAVISIFAVGAAWMVRSRETSAPGPAPLEVRRLSTALLPLRLVYQRELVEAGDPPGGAIARLGDAFILATGKGVFYYLSSQPTDSLLHATRLVISAPIASEVPSGDPASAVYPPLLRVTGLVVESRGDEATVYLAHEHWDAAEGCVSVRVSRTNIPISDSLPRVSATWHTLFTSNPCVRPRVGFDPFEGGGRLVRRSDGRLLLTLGYYGLTELVSGASSAGSDYGKVVVLDVDGTSETLTQGHRNPQGLLVDQHDRIWSTEHGPQGGDEINLLRPGSHYGWPYTTLGTKYGSYRWPPTEKPANIGLTEPVFAFVQSIGISNLIEVRHPAFDAWQGDLLVGSLLGQSLFRVRLAGDRVTYVEQIEVGARIRDLIQGADGRIVLWTDFVGLVTVSPAPGTLTGALVYERCSRCHRSNLRGTPLGPPLVGVVGREVASHSAFEYSEVLRSMGGTWTEDRLDAFLRDPAGFAPGTGMVFEGITDISERRALIAFLRGD